MNAANGLRAELGDESLLLIRETAAMVAFYRRLLERYELDALTGLPGSNRFRDYTKDIESRADSVGVVFFDINNLKAVNDTQGHAAGDLLIQKTAESIMQVPGKNLSAFRVGGDEFVIIIANCAEDDIAGLIDIWKTKLAELNKKDDGIICSVSVGSAYGTGRYRIGDVLKLADERMYEEKRRMKGL